MLGRSHWIFDLDGTLTEFVHDYPWMRRELGLPDGHPILEAIDALPADRRPAVVEKLHAIEQHYADIATPAPGAPELLEALRRRGATVGILTRNHRPIALRTLAVIGLGDFFDPAHVLGREDARFKPDPHGIDVLLGAWSAERSQAVFVGDSRHDLEAAENAGVPVVIVNPDPPPAWTGRAGLIVGDLHAVVAALETSGG